MGLGSIGKKISGVAKKAKKVVKKTVNTAKDVAALASPVNPASVKQLAGVAAGVAVGKSLDYGQVMRAMEYAIGPGNQLSQLGLARPGDGYRVVSSALSGGVLG